MKRLYFISGIIAACAFFFGSCNDEVDGELYKQMISFKAVIEEGDQVCHIYMKYQEDGTATYELPVIVSGTTKTTEDILVHVEVDNDTLDILNQECFPESRQDLWYRQLPEEYYTYESTCLIPAGSSTETLTITFQNLNNLDMSEKWVLPLTIVESDDYERNRRKGWCKALLYIHLYNDYSGTYSSTTANNYVDGTTSDPAVVDTRETRVVDEYSIFFYAGTIWEEDEDRGLYKVIARFNPDTEVENSDGSTTGTLVLEHADGDNNQISFEQSASCTYTRSVLTHATIPYMERHITTLYIYYNYSDITADPENPMRYNVTGSMTLERQINTLIPDEDQAIQW